MPLGNGLPISDIILKLSQVEVIMSSKCSVIVMLYRLVKSYRKGISILRSHPDVVTLLTVQGCAALTSSTCCLSCIRS